MFFLAHITGDNKKEKDCTKNTNAFRDLKKQKTEEVKFTLKNRRFSRSCPQVGHFVER